MNITVFCLCILSSLSLYAGTISFIGACDSAPLIQLDFTADAGANVGSITLQTLVKENIDFQGTERGFNSIFGTPTGLDAMEVISDTEMNAHGWCYSINGQAPELFPNEVNAKLGDKIVWWFGYAKYLDGEWITQCEPTHLRAPSQFCR